MRTTFGRRREEENRQDRDFSPFRFPSLHLYSTPSLHLFFFFSTAHTVYHLPTCDGHLLCTCSFLSPGIFACMPHMHTTQHENIQPCITTCNLEEGGGLTLFSCTSSLCTLLSVCHYISGLGHSGQNKEAWSLYSLKT